LGGDSFSVFGAPGPAFEGGLLSAGTWRSSSVLGEMSYRLIISTPGGSMA
jgi:hypothetical protein